MKPVKRAALQHPLIQWGAATAVAVAVSLFLHQGSFHRLTLAKGSDELAAVAEVRDIIESRWVQEPEDQQLLNGAVAGMVSTLDPFSAFISAEQLAAFQEETTGNFGGLGIYLDVNEDGLVVVTTPIEDTPAWKAGLLPGDIILAIDGRSYQFASAAEAVEVLKGEEGTSVQLTVLHEGADETEVITVERAIIKVQSVKGPRILEDGVGYLRLTSFNANSVDQFREALEGLQRDGLRGLILDLRSNPGGYLHASKELADFFLDEGMVIVETRGRDPRESQKLVADDPVLCDAPIAILINGGSASAAEIMAGAIRDNARATLVGRRSYGKGSVQTLIDVMGGRAQLKLTTQHYFTPSGRRIHRAGAAEDDLAWGLLPDIRVAVDPAEERRLAFEENEREMQRLRVLADAHNGTSGEEPAAERLHLDDPTVRAAFVHLQRVLSGEARLGPQPPSDSDLASTAPVTSQQPNGVGHDEPEPPGPEGPSDGD
jgi:carboxyl-terminal processing protease